MRLLNKYLLRDIFKPMFLSLILMLSLIWLMQSLRFMDLIINKGLDVGTFLWITALIIPTLLIVLLPLSLFAGTVYSFKRLNDDNELASLLAAGLSRWNITAPAFIAGCLVVGMCYFVSLVMIPAGMSMFKDIQNQLRESGGNIPLEEGSFNEVSDGITVYVKKRIGGNELQGVMVHDNRKEDRPITWIATRGKISFSEEGYPQLSLIEGTRQEVKDDSFNILEFQEHTINIAKQIQQTTERWRGSEERYIGELLHTEGLDERNKNRFISEFHKRLTWPLTPIPFILFAALCLVRTKQHRLGTFKATATACTLAAFYQAGIMISHNLGNKGIEIGNILQWVLPISVTLICTILLSKRTINGGMK